MKKKLFLLFAFVIFIAVPLSICFSIDLVEYNIKFSPYSDPDGFEKEGYIAGPNGKKVNLKKNERLFLNVPSHYKGKPVVAIDKFSGIEFYKVYIPETVYDLSYYGPYYVDIIEVTDIIQIHRDNKYFTSGNNCNAIIDKKNNTLLAGTNRSKIPEGVQTIADGAFASKTNLRTIVIPKSVKSIKSSAFMNCKKLKSVVFKGENIKLGNSCFYNCVSLSGTLDLSNVYIDGVYVFSCCKNIKKVILNKKMEIIPPSTFSDCTSLEKIEFPNSISSINSSAFENCTSLKKIHISRNVESVGDGAFSGCNSLKRITVDGGNKHLTSFEGSNVIVDKFNGKLIAACKNFKLNDEIKIIGNSCFKNSNFVKKLVLPDSVEKIDVWAFENARNLESIYIGPKVSIIANYSFYKNINLSSIEISPENQCYTSNNSNVIVEKATNILLYGCKNSIIYEGIETVADYAFTGLSGLKEIEIPGSVKTIKTSSFSNCINLESITLNEGLEVIERYAFAECYKVKSINIPVSLKKISSSSLPPNAEIYYMGTKVQWWKVAGRKDVEEAGYVVHFAN